MSRGAKVSVLVHKSMPECCKQTVLNFAKLDRYQGGGEPGDQIRCGCGHWLVYQAGRRRVGWRVKGAAPVTASSWPAVETVRDVLDNVGHSPTCQWGECPCREFGDALARLEAALDAADDLESGVTAVSDEGTYELPAEYVIALREALARVREPA